MQKITKAVFPVAGLGTRFLPATKSIPKEILTLVDAVQQVLRDLGNKSSEPFTELPRMNDRTGFTKFLQELKNVGMHPYIMGDFPSVIDDENPSDLAKKIYKGRQK